MGAEYALFVAAPGFAPVTAVSAIPPPIPISTLAVTNYQEWVDGNLLRFSCELSISYEDPIEQINFYNLRLYQQRIHYMIAFNGDTIRNGTSMMALELPEATNETWKLAINTGGILLQDHPFSQALTIPLQGAVERDRYLTGKIITELRTVSPEYYNFQSSLSSQPSSIGGGGLTPPVLLRSNVENGLGVFAGYASSTDSVSVRSR
ncbi:MAG: DUF4249 family protein [Lewinella sp.]|nr:DUF4249 family protein [Lewinella sp.]